MLFKDTSGDAVVEATVLFPIMIMIFAALVMLAIFLPTRAALQRATQYAATAIAVEKSDSWLYYDDGSMSYEWETDKGNLKSVYAELFSGVSEEKGSIIVTGIEAGCISSKDGTLEVETHIVNRIIYKEVVVTATREFEVPFLTFIYFPNKIPITVTSTAVVQNGDEFVRNMDLAVDFVEYLVKKFNLTNITDSISTFGKKVSTLFGWK